MSPLNCLIASSENDNVLDRVVDLQQPRLNTVVQICRKISNLIRQINDLSLKWRLLSQKILRELWMRSLIIVARVLDDPFARRQGQVQSTMCSISLFKVLNNSQSMEIVIKPQPISL